MSPSLGVLQSRPRRATLVTFAALLILASLVALAPRTPPHPLDDAATFLSPYEEVSWTPDPTPPGKVPTGMGTLSRRTSFAGEAARMRRLLSPSCGWKWSGSPSGGSVSATAQATSLYREIALRIPPLKDLLHPLRTGWY